MNRGSKIAIGIIGVVVLIMIGGYVYIQSTSGLDSPLSVVMSSSMQHNEDRSNLGIIDTGDVMVIRSEENTEIHSYVEGTIDGYRSFGDYGSVIIYERGGDSNPVIHRAIVWLEYQDGNRWSIPSLKDYNGKWEASSGTNYNNVYGTLTFYNITQSNKTVSINLDSIQKKSGYLTMGDNPTTNGYFDQTGIVSHPIGLEDIRAVAMYEIPWMGVIKVFMNDSKKDNLSHVPNSIISLIMLFVMIFILIFCCDFYHSHKELKENVKRIESDEWYR